jgi:predicted DNA-binding transcriptional regulator YafY
MTIGDLTPVVSWVLEWGGRARVVEPEALRVRVVEELQHALQQYEATPSRPRKTTRTTR